MGRTRKALLRGQGPWIGRASEGVFVPRDIEACRPREMDIYTEVHEGEPVNEKVNSTEI